MSGVNKVILVGRLGQDPESKHLDSGVTITNFSIATSEKWKNKTSGEMEEKTEWHRVVTFNKTAELAAQYLSKGKQVYLEGKLQTRSWEDDKGEKKYSTEVLANNLQFLGGNENKEQTPAYEDADDGF